jgi:hypothetical protein
MKIPCKRCIAFAICKAQFNYFRNNELPFLSSQPERNMYAVYRMYNRCRLIRPTRSIFVEENREYNRMVARTFTEDISYE